MDFIPTTFSDETSSGTSYPSPVSDFIEEPPLLEEIGVNFTHIRQKTLAVLNPFSTTIDEELLFDSDLAGPFFFCVMLGGSLLMTGKWTFDYIYGVTFVGSLAMFCLMNIMSELEIGLYRTISIMGYCLLPMVLLAILTMVLPIRTIIGVVLTFLCVLWCTNRASLMFTALLRLHHQRILVGYPLGLYYACFALLTIY
eukprot:TRINITY_DN10436_c0_g1_i1.p1 TRINITY_DN10436_c0_g1~~TRINITY_DN10436_c0_g1_i1.p1  ORF type:complete len:198 (-),score=20.15 TRINITY_DN10436_c0_g1_i1:24-617(-)